MAPRPIFTLTHPRACSTAFERVFMTRRDILECSHEPFADAFYLGPELMSDRFKDDAADRGSLGMSCSDTYQTVLDRFAEMQSQGKRLFIKDMAYYIMQPDGKPTDIAPSVGGRAEPANPTVLPLAVLSKFHFTFLIRHPRRSIPSYWRCCLPPLSDRNGFPYFLPSEAGYEELVRLFDYLLESGVTDKEHLTVLDADDLLDNPEDTIRLFCERTGIDYSPSMLEWSAEDGQIATEKFAKFDGFHDDCLRTTRLEGRSHAQKISTVESEDAEWTKKYGPEAQKIIRQTVNDNIPYYEYLKQFTIKA
ncbi:Branched-chain-amino-acid aminotransferase-like protein 2 [Beauveria bassiana]|nr:Branched-chain-amino-acid aminotransferase-like protein 2 [Beauveria bassiana]